MFREIEGLTAAPDRYITVYLDSARLVRGDYEVSLGVQTSSSADVETDHFPIHVR